VEYAMLKHPNGAPVDRSEARASYERYRAALARAGGRAPRDRQGRRLVWNQVDGWHAPEGATWNAVRDAWDYGAGSSGRGGLRVADAVRRQTRVMLEIERDEARAFRRELDPDDLRDLEDPIARRLYRDRDARLAHERADVVRRNQAATELFVNASEGAIWLMQQFAKGRVMRQRDLSMDEMVGKTLADYWPDGQPTRAAREARFAKTGIWI
jgi:hypothetical protein